MKRYLCLVALLLSMSCQRGNSPAASSGALQLRILKVYQSSSYAKIDFNLSNNSTQYIGYWQVAIDIFDENNSYLGHDYANGQNLRPNDSMTKSFNLNNVDASQIHHWKLSLERVRVEEPGGKSTDATRFYNLEELSASLTKPLEDSHFTSATAKANSGDWRRFAHAPPDKPMKLTVAFGVRSLSAMR